MKTHRLIGVGLIVTCFFYPLAFSEQDFRPRQVVPPFEAIVTPHTVGIDGADRWVRDHELVLGVVVEGEARAYPINMLTNPTREIINDKLGGRAIAATW